MTRFVPRGQVFFLTLAVLVVVDRLASILLASIRNSENLDLWRSILLPALVVFCMILLWRGETFLRWLMAAWSLLHGGSNLLVVASVMYHMAAVTPSEQMAFFLYTSAILFWFPIFHASFYIFMGLALLLSKSLKSFFDHQQEAAENPFTALRDWIVSFVKMKQSDDNVLQRVYGMIDTLNTEAGGGKPMMIDQYLGSLKIRSGILSLGDPQDVSSVELSNIDSHEVLIFARLWEYPSGGAIVTGLTIKSGNSSHCDPTCKIGNVGIDSAKLVVADKADVILRFKRDHHFALQTIPVWVVC